VSASGKIRGLLLRRILLFSKADMLKYLFVFVVTCVVKKFDRLHIHEKVIAEEVTTNFER